MADIEFPGPGGHPEKLKDMGDGTFAKVVATTDAGGGSGGGTVTIAGADGSNPVSDTNPLPVEVVSSSVTPTDRSGTIATADQAQPVMAANPDRKGFWIQNVSDSYLWVNELGAATKDQPSVRLKPDGLFYPVAGGLTTGAISIIGGTVGQAYSAREW